MVILVLFIAAWVLTKILKQEYTSSYVVFLVTMALLCSESRLFLAIFMIIVHFQTQKLKEEYRRSGFKTPQEFLEYRRHLQG